MEASPSQVPSSPVAPAPTAAVPATSAATIAKAAPLGGSGTSAGSAGAALLLAAMTAVALLAARRRRRAPRVVELVETASLGPKRSLVVARMGDELLLLGASEGGISLLATRAAPGAGAATEPSPLAPQATTASPSPMAGDSAVHGLLALFGRRRGAAPAFDRLLSESAEDVALRRKLAAGEPGSVR